MNKQRFKQVIDFLKEQQAYRSALNMQSWQTGAPVCNLDDFHACGNRACFAGYIALMPEFQATGGFARKSTGAPALGAPSDAFAPQGSHAVSLWLEATGEALPRLIRALVNGNYIALPQTPWEFWELSDLIPLLERILDADEDGISAIHKELRHNYRGLE